MLATRKKKPVMLCIAMNMTNHDLLREWGELPPEVQVLHLNALQDEYLERRTMTSSNVALAYATRWICGWIGTGTQVSPGGR